MAYQVYFSPDGLAQANERGQWLATTYSARIKMDFLVALSERVATLAQTPLMWPISPDYPDSRRCVIDRFTLMLYKVDEPTKSVEIFGVYDSRRPYRL